MSWNITCSFFTLRGRHNAKMECTSATLKDKLHLYLAKWEKLLPEFESQ